MEPRLGENGRNRRVEKKRVGGIRGPPPGSLLILRDNRQTGGTLWAFGASVGITGTVNPVCFGWREDQVLLILWFLALVAAGDVLAYIVGLFVEYEWGEYPSLIVFLAMYFITLWFAWRMAVWLTRPKPASDSTSSRVA
jgi:hypothetical protein